MTRLALYSFSFLPFSQVQVVRDPGQAGVQLASVGPRGIGTPGERFGVASGAGALTEVLVEDDAAFVADGLTSASGARAAIAAGSLFGIPGQAVDLAYRIDVLTDDDPAEDLSFFVLSVGGINVGLLGENPLLPGSEYTVTLATDQYGPVTLRQFGQGRPGTEGQAAGGHNAWDAALGFTAGTMVDTPQGPRLIDALAVGDLVSTLDNGSQPLRWVGRRTVSPAEMAAEEALRPVEFAPGTFGNSGLLRVSAQHRMLLNDWRAEVYFGEDNVLIPARALVNGSTIRQIFPETDVTYVQLLFDRHEVILSEGALSESFHPGATGLETLDEAQRLKIEALFPGLERRRAAFPIVRMAEARALRLPG